jgi:ribose transport system substrate-binding protein
MKKAVTALSLALLLTAACGPKAEHAKPRVALVMKSLANEFFKTMEDGAREHQKANAGEYDLVAAGIKDEQDVGQQIRLVEQQIADGAAAIVLAPADSKGLVPVCQKALAAGIVVVNIDNKLDATVLAERKIAIPFVGPDNRAGARKVGERLASRLKPGDSVGIVEGIPTAFNAIERKRGFEDAMAAAGIVVRSSQSASWEAAKANQAAAAMISETPSLKALLCANDSMALGAVAALKAARRDDVLVVGFDNISAVRELVKSGRVLATADQHGDRLAVFGIEYALEALRTHAPAADRETPVDLVTAESLP